MRNRGQVFVGAALVIIGVVLAIGAIFKIDVWAFCWPLALILVGVWFLVRPRFLSPGTFSNFHPLGGIRRFGSWTVANEEIWMFVGDVELDLVHAELPAGETTLRIYGFVGDVDVSLPADVGLSYTSTAFVTDSRINERKLEGFILPTSFTSDNYLAAEKRIRLETLFFVADVKVRII
jgi:lia operon protein LiaF